MIKRIEIKNFKKFKDQSIELHPQGITLICGGNNSGKTTLLQALAVWGFCRTIVETLKGKEHLLAGNGGTGAGININDFHPIGIPDLAHLWTNTSTNGTYTLSIACIWDDKSGMEKRLAFSMSLVQERLYIKQSDSNLSEEDQIPNIAYIPPFAGIEANEGFHNKAKKYHRA